MKVLLLIVAAFAIVALGVFRLASWRDDDLGSVDMNDARRQDFINAEADRWK